MTVLAVFNDLSTDPLAPDMASGRARLEELSLVLTDQRIQGKKVFIGPSYFLHVEVSGGYTVGRWLAEYRSGDHERRLRLKTLFDRRLSYEECVPPDQLYSENVEYRFAGRLAVGLSAAFCSGGLALSLHSSDQWNVTSLSLEKAWINNEDVETRTLSVPHACRVFHLESHSDWLRRNETPPPQNGVELWSERGSLFPNLDFCDSVQAQITTLGGNEPRFRAVFRGLQDLQNYCHTWDTPYFDIHRLANASGESQTTMDMYADERTFLCPDGQYRAFEWHLKRGDTRIHFFDFPAPRRILVGYTGAHLRISSQ